MSARTKHEANRQRFILPPSTPFRRKRIPIACALLPAASIVGYLAYSALDYLSGGHAVLTSASSGLVLHTVWRYAVRLAPSEDKLGGAWEDLKFRYGPLAIVCMCLFFRVGSAVFGVCCEYDFLNGRVCFRFCCSYISCVWITLSCVVKRVHS